MLLMIPTFIGITLVCFVVINSTPGGPIEQKLQQLRFSGVSSIGGGAGSVSGFNTRGSQQNMGIPQEYIEELKKQYGLDKNVWVRYFIWLKNIFTLNFGRSFTHEEPAWTLIVSKFPVSLQFGIVSFLLTYLICIPLGVLKAVRHLSFFDVTSSVFLMFLYSIPSLALGILLIVFLGGQLDWFPIYGLYSDNYEFLPWYGKIMDRIHHFILPLACYMVGSFTVLTFLMKNSLIGEIKSDYVRTARAKGLKEKVVVYKHALRNALIPIATGFGSILSILLAGSIVIEQIFGIDGIGLLAYKSILNRDYNVIMGLIFLNAVIMLLGRLLSDLLYVIIDPRIDFR